jgi:hypothetical protein
MGEMFAVCWSVFLISFLFLCAFWCLWPHPTQDVHATTLSDSGAIWIVHEDFKELACSSLFFVAGTC